MNENCLYKDVCTNECTSGCVRYNSMKALLDKSGLPTHLQKEKTLIAYEEDIPSFQRLAEIKSEIMNFVVLAKNLYIYSDTCGNGKTSWSIKLMLAYFDKVWSQCGFDCKGYFIHTPTLLTRLKSFDTDFSLSDEERNRLLNANLVIWDDIASTKLSEFDHTMLLTYLDQRINKGLSNIFTGNCGEDDCYTNLGGRLHSRVWTMSERIELREFDKRGLKE